MAYNEHRAQGTGHRAQGTAQDIQKVKGLALLKLSFFLIHIIFTRILFMLGLEGL